MVQNKLLASFEELSNQAVCYSWSSLNFQTSFLVWLFFYLFIYLLERGWGDAKR